MRSRRRRRYRYHKAIEKFAARLSEYYASPVPRQWDLFLAWFQPRKNDAATNYFSRVPFFTQ